MFLFIKASRYQLHEIEDKIKKENSFFYNPRRANVCVCVFPNNKSKFEQ